VWTVSSAPDVITTARLVLEPLRVDHAAEMAPLLDDPALHEFIGGSPSTVEQLRATYERQAVGRSAAGDELWFNWIARADGDAVGYVQATVTGEAQATAIGAAADLAWVIAVPHQGRGFAREAALGMLDWLRSRGVRTFTAHIAPGHAASASVARALGLTPTDAVEDGETVWRT
jgi:RimJ/RimL family protein N-acetyltransferase